ncbi:MAG: hypothetical protein NVSMB6_02210 [Burkholderiaceae bacterium]
MDAVTVREPVAVFGAPILTASRGAVTTGCLVASTSPKAHIVAELTEESVCRESLPKTAFGIGRWGKRKTLN